VDAVRHEPTRRDEVTIWVNCWQSVPSRERDNEIAMGVERSIGRHHQPAVRYLCKRFNGTFDIGSGLDMVP